MREISINPISTSSIVYRNPKFFSKNAQGQIVAGQTGIPVYIGSADLPEELDALIITSDLQGTIDVEGSLELMGLHMPGILEELIAAMMPGIALSGTGVLLCGDLYAHKKKRGGYGDVSAVWRGFNERFAWVAGVQGNHDLFGSNLNKAAFVKETGIHLLDATVKNIAGLTIGGVGLVIGNTSKPNRLSSQEYLANLSAVLRQQPDILILHAAPHLDDAAIGDSQITEMLNAYAHDLLVFCGHEKWESLHRQVNEQVHVVNVDERVLLLVKH